MDFSQYFFQSLPEVENLLVNNNSDEYYSVPTDIVLQQLGPSFGDEFLLHDEIVLVPTFPGFSDAPVNMNVVGAEAKTVRDQGDDAEQAAPDSSSSMSTMVASLQKKDKICLVCGDKALGYNFNAVSCESCKAFFRRNAHKTIRGRCEGKCEVTVDSRSFCKKCRLNKCFSIGMRKDMILNDEQKKQRKQKIIINKLRKHGQLPPEDTYAASPQDFANTFQDQIKNQSIEDLRATFPTLNDSDLLMLMKLKTEKRNVQCSYNSETCPNYPSWSESQDLINDIIESLPDMEKGILVELRHAHEQTEFLASTSSSLKNVPKNTTEFVNIAEVFVRKIIKLAKYIEFFKMVGKDDQIVLLKGSVVEIMMLRSAVNYDVATESWSLNTKACISRSKPSSTVTSAMNSPSTPESASSSSGDNPLFSGNGMDMGMINAMRERARMMGLDVDALRQRAASFGIDVTNFSGRAHSTGEKTETVGLDLTNKPKETEEKKEMTTISSDVLKMGNPEAQNMFLTYSKFIKSLMKVIHGDLLILKILIMLSLFSPDRCGLAQPTKIQEIQECYARILQRYVHDRFPEDGTLFAKIIMKLTDLRNINEVHTKMLLRMKIDNIEPLLVEIFDLPCGD